MPAPNSDAVTLTVVLRAWGRLGCVGFGGPPAHIRLLRQLCVERHPWIDADEFEDAIAACSMLPGPSSTQMAIYCAGRVAGRAGAVVGGVAFIVPGLVAILALAALFLGDPPWWIAAAGAGAGAAVAAVALHAALDLMPSSWIRSSSRPRWVMYVVAAGVTAALAGPWVVAALLGCGASELALRRQAPRARADEPPEMRSVMPLLALLAVTGGAVQTLGSLAWVALKVGALSYGGGFVIMPLMQADAVHQFRWMSDAEFVNAVALGQVTPGPVVHTVAVVGYAAAGIAGGLFTALVAFGPSFAFVLAGADRFDALRTDDRVKAFLDGSGPAAIGAILGSAWLFASALHNGWQFAILAGAVVTLVALRRSVVLTLLTAATVGVALVTAGAPLP